MVRTVSTYDATPYGMSDEEIEGVILARSHSIWGQAGRPVAPPDQRGHALVGMGKILSGIATLLIGLFFGAHLLLGEKRINDLGRDIVPAERLPAGFDPGGVLLFAFILICIALLAGGGMLGLKGSKMLRQAPQDLAGRAVSTRNVGRRLGYWSLAVLLMLAGAFLFSRPFLKLDQEIDLNQYLLYDLPPALAGLLMIICALYAGERGHRLGKPSASELQRADPRPPIVLLRSFHDDDLQVVRVTTTAKGRQYSFVRLEEAVGDPFAPYGPLVAIGRPGEPLPTAGAARNYYSNAEWQDAVAKWMDQSQIILLVPGRTKGLGWELGEIARRGHIGKLMVLIPSAVGSWGQWFRSIPVLGWIIGALAWLGLVTDAAKVARQDLQQRWDIVRKALAEVPAFAAVPAEVPEGAVVLHLGRDQKPTVVVGPRAAEEKDVESAIRLAVYGMFCHA